MEKNIPKRQYCNHCGGTLAFSGDDYSCLMCGRGMDHECELCLTKPSKRKGRRKTAVTR